MKANLSVLIGILLLVLVLLAGPVTAATASGSAAVIGNPKASVSIALNQSSVYLDLDPTTSPNTNLTQAVIVSSNIAFSITVQDNSGRAVDLGYMGNYTGAAYETPTLDTNLTYPLGLTGTTNSTTSAVAVTPPITDTPQALYTGTQKVNYQWLMPTTVSQVVTFSDAVLPAGSTYRIDLQFTITST